MEVDFEEIMDQDSEEVLSDDTSYASDLREHDTDHAEKFVSRNPLNGRTKHCMIQCYYTWSNLTRTGPFKPRA